MLYCMKKIGALSFAAFYLMLTTGLFVCLLHCAMASSFSPESTAAHQEPEVVSGTVVLDKDCDCCEHHGEYAVKENAKTSATAGLKTRSVWSAVSQQVYAYLIRTESAANIGRWTAHTSSPAFKKTPIYLSNRVLII